MKMDASIMWLAQKIVHICELHANITSLIMINQLIFCDTKSLKMDESFQCIECEKTFFDMYKKPKTKFSKKWKKWKKTQKIALFNYQHNNTWKRTWDLGTKTKKKCNNDPKKKKTKLFVEQ